MSEGGSKIDNMLSACRYPQFVSAVHGSTPCRLRDLTCKDDGKDFARASKETNSEHHLGTPIDSY